MIYKVSKGADILIVEELAAKIWNSHYTPIIGQDQVNYMLEKFQSYDAIKSQIEKGADYYLISNGKNALGYLCLIPDTATNKLMISKIYIDKNESGNGFGTQLINFTKNIAKEKNIKTVWLTVNKDNSNSINFYKNLGFKITKEAVMNIGNGFVMDDFVMEFNLD